jgi:hypothetical protein
MKVAFVPLTPSLLPACRAFNDRLRNHGNAPFFLPEESPDGNNHHIAVDDTGDVRGGVLLMEQRGWLGGNTIPLINVQSPLTEGIIDRRFSGVGLQMLKFLTQRSPYLYAVGMGSEQNPFARLLAAAGWRIARAPFFYSVVHAGRFLREIGPLRHGPRRVAAQIASRGGLGAIASGLWRLAHRPSAMGGYSLDPVSTWPAEVDAIWERERADLAFASVRDRAALNELYPQSQARLCRWVLRRQGSVAGWSAALLTDMESSAYFGNLRVGTILDGLAPAEHLEALIALSHRALADLNADLILTNQTLPEWHARLRRLGFLPAASNYLLAVSKPISAALKQAGAAESRIHVNRGDGDGRLHL